MIHVVIVIAIVGIALYLLNAYVPMAPPVKTILNVVVVVALLLWLLSVFGIVDVINRPVR